MKVLLGVVLLLTMQIAVFAFFVWLAANIIKGVLS